MTLRSVLFCSALTAMTLPAMAEGTREMDAHVHGHGALNIAIENAQIAIELEVPGFDIVGFEYDAASDADKAAVEAALDLLRSPDELFGFSDAAGCAVTQASAQLHGADEHGGEDDHEGEGHDDHGHEDDDHDDHEGEGHDDHGDDAEAHDDHAESAHSEFHAEYLMTCSDIAQVTRIELPFFDVFENAEELEVQIVTETGALAAEATRSDPSLDLTGAM